MNFVFNAVSNGNYTSIPVNIIPETGFFGLLNNLNSAMSDALSAFLPDSGVLALFAKFPLLVIIALFVFFWGYCNNPGFYSGCLETAFCDACRHSGYNGNIISWFS